MIDFTQHCRGSKGLGIPKDKFLVQSIPSECAAHASDMKYGPYWPDVIHFLFSNMKKDKALFAISYAPYQSPKKEIWASNCNKSNPSISSSNSKANLSNWHIRNDIK